MKLTMNLNKVVTRTINLFRSPISEWRKIKLDDQEPKRIFLTYLFPLLLIGCFFKLAGCFLSTADYSLINALVVFISYFVISISIIYASSWLINEILPKFKTKKDFKSIFKLVSFSSFPSILFIGISALHPSLVFINLVSLYSVVLFWIGTPVIIDIPKEFKIGFTLISILLVITISLIISFVLMSLILSTIFLKI